MNPFKILLLLLMVECGLDCAVAQTWTQTSAPAANWYSVASSADGKELVAVIGGQFSTGQIYTSTNAGASWTLTAAPTRHWNSVASSVDGGKLIAVGFGEGIYTSMDSGNTWVSNNLPSNSSWCSVASSADGNVLAAAAQKGSLYTSTDSGVVWAQATNAPSLLWDSVACSADGNKLVAAANTAYCISTNKGATWASNSVPSGHLLSAAFSADGNKLVMVAGINFGPVYVSTNSGLVFHAQVNAPGAAWRSVASSADGTHLAAIGANNGVWIYASTNSGASWATNNLPNLSWRSIATSADGRRLVAVIAGGGIYTLQTAPSPQLNFRPSSNNLALSWIIPSTNFVLQQSSNLVSWADVTNTPVLNLTNLQNEVTLTPSNSSGFYRLKTP